MKYLSYDEWLKQMEEVYIPLGVNSGEKYRNWATKLSFQEIPFPNNFYNSPKHGYKGKLGFSFTWKKVFQ